jgi:hypothetical protein
MENDECHMATPQARINWFVWHETVNELFSICNPQFSYYEVLDFHCISFADSFNGSTTSEPQSMGSGA